MIRSSSREVKPNRKFEEFRLTSSVTATGKKRGRPRKYFNNSFDPSAGRLVAGVKFDDSISSLDAHPTTSKVNTPTTTPHRPVGRPPLSHHQHRHRGRPRKEPKPLDTSETASNISEAPAGQLGFSTPQAVEHRIKPLMSRKEEIIRLRDENQTIRAKIEQMEADLENLKSQSSYTGSTIPKIDYDQLTYEYQRDVTYAKRHEWCKVCLNESKYYCCWNTTYCSQKCQLVDWYARHGRSCERQRAVEKLQAASRVVAA